jgi:predicted Zn-dependent peptidase
LREVNDASSSRPFTDDELSASSGYLLGSRPVRYENAGTLLSEIQSNWLYGLPADWITAYADNVRAVTLENAQAAWNKHIVPQQLSILVVGDKNAIHEGLKALSLPIIELNSDGEPMETK